MKRLLSVLLITWSMIVNAGLPPTTLSGQSSTTKPVTFNFKVPNNQATVVAGGTLIETGNDNLLINPSFEGTLGAEWVITTGTAVKTTTSGEYSEGKAGLKITPSANVMDFYQQVNVTGIQQKVASIDYKVPATCTTFVIRIYADGVLQSTVPTTNLIKDGTWRTIEVPLTATSTAKINPYASGSCTGDSFFDRAYIKSGVGTQALQLDNVYTGKISSTSVISNVNKTFFSGCTVDGSGIHTCTISTALGLTAAPNCTLSRTDAGNNPYGTTTQSSTQVVFAPTVSATAGPLTYNCQKSGNDYLASSAAVYSQASANTDWTSYTPTFSASFGTVTSINMKWKRFGDSAWIRGYFSCGVTTAAEAQIGLPPGLTSSSNIGALESADGFGNAPSTAGRFSDALMEPSKTYFTIGVSDPASSGTMFNKQNANFFCSNGLVYFVNARIPIQGWSNSSQIVGSFEKIERCANTLECMDVFSAKISNTGVVTDENYDFLNGNCSGNNPFSCNFNSGIFTVAPNCQITHGGASDNAYPLTSSISSSNISYYIHNLAGANSPQPIFLSCQRTGVDSKPKTAKVAVSIGVPTVPGITTEAVDTFSFTFGTTNASTVCSASPCSYLDQIGTAVSSVTRASTGTYTLNFAKTYTKLKCNAFVNPATLGFAYASSNGTLNCSNCNSLPLLTYQYNAVIGDATGTVMCQGSY